MSPIDYIEKYRDDAIAEMKKELEAVVTNRYIEKGHPERIKIAVHYKEMYMRMRQELAEARGGSNLN